MKHMGERVVVTGMGVVAPNGIGLAAFESALRKGTSGIKKVARLEELGFRCQVGGIPEGIQDILPQYFSEEDLMAMNQAMVFGSIAAIDAWKDAGLTVPERKADNVHWDTGCIFGSGLSGIDTVGEILVPTVNAGKVRRMGSTIVERVMSSSISAKLAGLLSLGNQVSSNSSACNTGTEAIHDCFYRIHFGLASRMLAGGAESPSPYVWAGFDAMRVLNGNFNGEPEKASRPMSATAGGLIPAGGAGALVLESLDSAKERGAHIYAEILSASVNCGGHRMGGSMTAPNRTSVMRCIQKAIELADIRTEQIDAINGHLTATIGDPIEIMNWSQALERDPQTFPKINSTKSMIGHTLGAAGAIESVATILQLTKGFLHPSINCEDVHQAIEPFAASIVQHTLKSEANIIAKSSFGFGDVNGCLIFKRWN